MNGISSPLFTSSTSEFEVSSTRTLLVDDEKLLRGDKVIVLKEIFKPEKHVYVYE